MRQRDGSCAGSGCAAGGCASGGLGGRREAVPCGVVVRLCRAAVPLVAKEAGEKEKGEERNREKKIEISAGRGKGKREGEENINKP